MKNELDIYNYENRMLVVDETKPAKTHIAVKHETPAQFFCKKLEKEIYRAKGASYEFKQLALAQGFKHVRGIELDGTPCPGGFYIRKKAEKESKYHFITKHLFAELYPGIRIEYCLEGKRVDAAYAGRGVLVGIEIETGTNKVEQVVGKIPWLQKNFSHWIFVCPRDQVLKHLKFVDNKQSFCLPLKRAKEKLLELIAAIEQR